MMLVLPKRLGSVEALAFLSGGRLLVTANASRKMPVWDLDAPVEPVALLANEARYRLPIFLPLPTDDYLLCGDDALRVLDPRRGDPVSTLGFDAGVYRVVVGIAFHPAARLMAFVNSHQRESRPIGSVFQYDEHYNLSFVENLPPGVSGLICRACAFDAAGTHLIVAADNPSETLSARLTRFPIGNGGTSQSVSCAGLVEQLLVDPVSGHLLVRSRYGVWVYFIGSGDWLLSQAMRLDEASRYKITAVALHPSGRFLAATSNDATVKFFDTKSWTIATVFTWDIGRMRSVAFSPDGAVAAAGSDSGRVVVWDVDA